MSATGIWQVEAKDTAQHPNMHKTVPHPHHATKNDLVQMSLRPRLGNPNVPDMETWESLSSRTELWSATLFTQLGFWYLNFSSLSSEKLIILPMFTSWRLNSCFHWFSGNPFLHSLRHPCCPNHALVWHAVFNLQRFSCQNHPSRLASAHPPMPALHPHHWFPAGLPPDLASLGCNCGHEPTSNSASFESSLKCCLLSIE